MAEIGHNIGHNRGPVMDVGVSYRKHCWTKARKDLLPQLPIEVIRGRVRRAKEIGLDYKTYATVRAATGRDIVAFLFSTNALRLLKQQQKLSAERVEKLTNLRGIARNALVIAPLNADDILSANPTCLDAAAQAPYIHAPWAEAAKAMDAARPAKLPADAIVMIGDTHIERDWATAGRLAGYLETSRFFTTATR